VNIVKGFLNPGDIFLRKINLKLLCIIVLNITDGILTYLGISGHYIEELNILMTGVVSNIYFLLFIKIVTPTLLLILTAYAVNKYDYRKMKFAVLLINICFIAYIIVFIAHLAWIIQLLVL
jgi:hypothetical protein